MPRYRPKASDIDLEYAAHPRKPATGVQSIDNAELMYVQRPRPEPSAPEPVDVSRALGRPPLEWEAYLIIEARQQERARERMMLP